MEVDTTYIQKHLVGERVGNISSCLTDLDQQENITLCDKITEIKNILGEKNPILSTIYHDNIELYYPAANLLPLYLSNEPDQDWTKSRTSMNFESSPEDAFSDFGLKENISNDSDNENNQTNPDENNDDCKNELTKLTNNPFRMTSSDVNRTDDFFSWPNDVKVNFNCIKANEECGSDAASCTESEPSVSNSGGKKRKVWDETNNQVNDIDEDEVDNSTNDKNTGANKKLATNEGAGSRMPPWQVESIEDMAAELDGSLSGLGVDLTTASYNMSEALLSLPSLTVFKQEAPSPSTDNLLQQTNQNVNEQTLQRYLQQQTTQPTYTGTSTAGMSNTICKKNNETSFRKNDEYRFQYVLAAATSIATKVTEEPLTYLNQGQSYEIKLKKIGELLNFRGKLFKSVIRICFHERRMQYMEREQILQWQASRPGERIVELDLPLSYNVIEIDQEQNMINTVSFLWDPTKEVGASIKVNCISTEFTPKKHGGEKGVPFRIQVETFFQEDPVRLHAGACQIKVFKLKGADRKHKQDREKIQKRSLLEQDKYQPAYECTVLNDLTPEQVFPAPAPLPAAASTTRINNLDTTNLLAPQNSLHTQIHNKTIAAGSDGRTPCSDKSVEKSRSPNISCIEQTNDLTTLLTTDSTPQQAAIWLQKNSFENYVGMFTNFNGADLLRLTREDLIQICGLPDGIRLFYALHSKAIVRLTIYICTPCSSVYHAVYLDNIGRSEICRKLSSLLGIQNNQIHDIYLQGPNGIHIMVTDEVVGNIKDESMFSIEIMKDEGRERYRILLKPAT